MRHLRQAARDLAFPAVVIFLITLVAAGMVWYAVTVGPPPSP
jgi:hypothetical protein